MSLGALDIKEHITDIFINTQHEYALFYFTSDQTLLSLLQTTNNSLLCISLIRNKPPFITLCSMKDTVCEADIMYNINNSHMCTVTVSNYTLYQHIITKKDS